MEPEKSTDSVEFEGGDYDPISGQPIGSAESSSENYQDQETDPSEADEPDEESPDTEPEEPDDESPEDAESDQAEVPEPEEPEEDEDDKSERNSERTVQSGVKKEAKKGFLKFLISNPAASAVVLCVFIFSVVIMFLVAGMIGGNMEKAKASENPDITTTPNEATVGGLISPPRMGGPDSHGYYSFPFPSSLYSGYGARNLDCNHWGSLTLNQVIYSTIKAFAGQYPNVKIAVGDFNSSGHITHRTGIDADIFIPGGMVDYRPYNRELAIAYAKLLFQTKTIRWIYYDDATVDAEVNAWAKQQGLPGGMKVIGGHGNHFHVRLDLKYEGPTYVPSCPN